MDLILRRRVLQNGLVLATTLITCTALQANDQNTGSSSPQSSNSGAPQSTESSSSSSTRSTTGRQHEQGNQQEKFVQKALMGGQMEVQMGQLAQQNGQDPQVKALGQTLVQDHTQANQRLQQIAQQLNITATAHSDDHSDKQQKHQQELAKLRNANGQEFDREFVKMALKDHKKDISEFERAQQQVNDPQLKSFIQQTLPKLRQHLQMAQAAAKSVGVDEASLSSDDNANIGVGAPASSQSGSGQPSSNSDSSSSSKSRSSLDSGSGVSGSAQVGDHQVSGGLNADVDHSDRSATITADTDASSSSANDNGKIFQKGDGKVLGLPTSKTDGKYLGIIPKPGADHDTDVSVDADAKTDNAVGGSARTEIGTSTDHDHDVNVEVKTDK